MWVFRVGLAIVLTAIVYLSVRPFPVTGSLPTNDKLGHLIAYLTLAFIGLHCFQNEINRRWFLLFACVLGISLEAVQYFVPGRHSTWLDLGANTAGIVLAIPLYLLSCYLWKVLIRRPPSVE